MIPSGFLCLRSRLAPADPLRCTSFVDHSELVVYTPPPPPPDDNGAARYDEELEDYAEYADPHSFKKPSAGGRAAPPANCCVCDRAARPEDGATLVMVRGPPPPHPL